MKFKYRKQLNLSANYGGLHFSLLVGQGGDEALVQVVEVGGCSGLRVGLFLIAV